MWLHMIETEDIRNVDRSFMLNLNKQLLNLIADLHYLIKMTAN